MPKSVAINIYTTKYWKTPYYDCDTLASGVDLSVFDFGVNSGPARAKKYLDQSIGGSPTDTIIKLNDKRLAFLQGLRTWGSFGVGWGRRVAGIKAKSLDMAKHPLTKAEHTVPGAVVATTAAAAAWSFHGWTVTNMVEAGVAAAALAFIFWVAIKYFKNRKINNVVSQ
jgi:lysozyme family protein